MGYEVVIKNGRIINITGLLWFLGYVLINPER